MAVIRDVMPAFDLLQPTSAAEAQKLLEKHKDDAWVMAGGLDSFDWLKDRIKKPKVLVDLSGIDELRGIRVIERRRRDRRDDHADGDRESSGDQRKLQCAVRAVSNWWRRRRFATRARWAATYRRTCAAGTTAADGRATAPAATFVTPTRRWDATASMRSSARTAAWPCIRPIRCRR